MKQANKLAVVGMLAFALSAPVFAQGAGGGSNSDGGKTEGPDSGMAASAPHHMKHKKGTGGTTMHQQNKASHLKGASAAKAASAMGTNDKGAPQ